MDIKYNEEEVCWEYEGNHICYKEKFILEAILKNNMIFVLTLCNNIYENHYVNYKGKEVLSYIDRGDEIKVYDEKNCVSVINVPPIYDLDFVFSDLFFLIAGELGNKKLYEYTINGNILKEYEPPQNYCLVSFNKVTKDFVMVRCQKLYEDPIDHRDHHFKLNVKNNKWIDCGISY